jgi:hypothetical protein
VPQFSQTVMPVADVNWPAGQLAHAAALFAPA